MTVHYDDITIGDSYTSSGRTLTEADIVSFAGLTGDFNPLHTDEEWVRTNTEFRTRIAHGLLVLSIGSGLRVSGLEDWKIMAFLNVERQMSAPAYPGDTIRQQATVTSLRPSKSRPGSGIVVLSIEMLNQHGEVLQSGTDTVLVGGAR